MNKETFLNRLVWSALVGVGMLSAGCTTNGTGGAPVRDSRPMSSARAQPQLQPEAAVSPAASVPRPGEHVVGQKEHVYSIARQYGIHPNDLIAWNKLSRPDQLEIGQTLRLTPPEAVVEPIAPPSLPSEAVLSEVKREPRGGKEAWSEEAWARLHPQQMASGADGNVPSATMSRPELSSPQPAAPDAASMAWIWPVKGTIIRRFDEATNTASKALNKGIDIAGTAGTPVLAAAGGKVAYAGDGMRELGNLLIIQHNDEYLTAYAHNRAILVKVGDTVEKGQKVAELGSSGTDRPKLHFELRKRGQPIDPLKYLPGL
ncbi:MAG: M23 family metallopeptidase [Azoarcus sp.]|jgi:lipoprotein NlpD|nr:M23 family metallopeptidase [Azoarcus sp.]